MTALLASASLALLFTPPPRLHEASRASIGRCGVCSMKQATKAGKGFGAAKVKMKKRKGEVPLDADVKAALDELQKLEPTMQNYLNPAHLEPEALTQIGQKLQAGEVVVLRDAFHPAFAEMVHCELKAKDVPWSLNEAYFEDGYHHHHHNVYDRGLWSKRLNATFDVFAHSDSKRLMAELSGRDCLGEVCGAPSWYKAGDHSLPHTDWVGQRTVSYVWHLSKQWRPEWGGALYWAQHHHSVATYPASFNTLVLFSVTTRSAHFVTTVSPNHKGKRLTFNGWWQSDWMPTLDDDLEGVLTREEHRSAVTHTQMQAITDLVTDPWQNIDAERRERLNALRMDLHRDLFPDGARAGIEA